MKTLSIPASWNNPWQDGWNDPTNPRPAYMPNETPLGSGPHKAILASEPGAEELVAYYPANLAALGATKLPVLVWGNGSCTFNGNKYRHLLTDVASYGYFVLAGGRMNPNGGANETTQIRSNNALRNPMAPPAPAAPAATPAAAGRGAAPARAAPDAVANTSRSVTVETLSHGIDWAIAENKKAGGKFFNRLDTQNIAVMGHSCGGGLASNFGNDPRVKTLAFWNSGGNAARAAEITKPTLISPGDPRFDTAYWGANATYKVLRKSSTPVAFAWRANMTHLGTFRTVNGGLESVVIRAWLDYQLKGDRNAARMFIGDDCVLCNTPGWQVESRNLK
jgi:dienelactone hydrolase